MRPYISCLFLLACLGEAAHGHTLPRARLEAWAAFSRSQGGQAILVWEHGKLRMERYVRRDLARTPLPLMSGAKNFWALALLQAQDDKLLDLDDPACGTLVEWKGDPQKGDLTVRDLTILFPSDYLLSR
jgi:CubicO group peptidase (beta-lactamase class C family)